MAIIKCPECGNNVSDRADNCVHCGCPLHSPQNSNIKKIATSPKVNLPQTPGNQHGHKSGKFLQSKKPKLSSRKWFVLLMLFLFFPIGVVLLWKTNRFKVISKILLSVLLGLPFLFWVYVFYFVFFCPHTEWEPATCIAPKTCVVCGETEGKPLGHEWEPATCISPKTCSICGETVGEALGHIPSEWGDWHIDYDTAENEREIVCVTCEEVLESESEHVTSFVSGERFTIYPEAFSDRFDASFEYIEDFSFESKIQLDNDRLIIDEDYSIFYEIWDDDHTVGLYSFLGNNGKYVPMLDQYTRNCVKGVLILVEDLEDMAAVTLATIFALDPEADFAEAADLGDRIIRNINSENGIVENSIKYVFLKDSQFFYLQATAVGEPVVLEGTVSIADNIYMKMSDEDVAAEISKVKELLKYKGHDTDSLMLVYPDLKKDGGNHLTMNGNLFGIDGQFDFMYDTDTNLVDCVFFKWIPDDSKKHESHAIDCLNKYFGEFTEEDESYHYGTSYYYHSWWKTTLDNWSVYMCMTEDSGSIQFSQLIPD